MSFQIHALAPDRFETLFAMSDGELSRSRAKRMRVDDNPGYPCRVSLADASIGETVILVNFEHLGSDTPYRSAHAIFVRENAEQAFPGIGIVPEMFQGRTISVRAFDNHDWMADACIAAGSKLGETINSMFENEDVAYLHLHNAQRGCYMARATRA